MDIIEAAESAIRTQVRLTALLQKYEEISIVLDAIFFLSNLLHLTIWLDLLSFSLIYHSEFYGSLYPYIIEIEICRLKKTRS